MSEVSENQPRVAGCVCTWEQGDSDCPVHAMCPACGESLENTRLFKSRAEWRTDYNIAASERDSACGELEKTRAVIAAAEAVIRHNAFTQINGGSELAVALNALRAKS